MKRAVLSIIVLFFLVATSIAVELPESKQPTLQIELTLYDALYSTYSTNTYYSPLLMVLQKNDQQWLPAIGISRDCCIAVHKGELKDVELSDGRLKFVLNVDVYRDTRGSTSGPANYTVEMEKGDDGTFVGHYQGSFNGTVLAGKAEAKILPVMQRNANLPKPPAGDEHPRILFRKSDIPALKKKAQTPLGRAALEKMSGPAGLAMKYVITGKRQYANEAIPLIESMMKRGMVSDQYGNNVGDRLEKTALAYDMCYDVWPDDFRRRVETYMLWAGEGVLRARRDTHQAVNWHICSNWSSPLYTGAGFAGLALWGKNGPAPERPESASTETGTTIAPDEKYKPGRGVPVFNFKSDEMSPDWIFVGGLKTDQYDGDPLQSIGGVRDTRPQLGQTVRFGGKQYRFEPVPKEKDKGYWRNENYDDGKLLIDITNACGREYFSTNYFYIVVRNDRPRRIRYEAGSHTSPCYLAGIKLQSGEVARLEPGLYPMLVEAYIDQINPWGRQLMRPRLIEITEEEATASIERQTAAAQAELAQWEAKVAEWERLGGVDLRYRNLFLRSRYMMYMFCREAVGDGGMQAELTHYSAIAEKPPSRYMSAHLQMFGYHVSPQQDIEDLLPRKMFVHTYPKDGEPQAVEINGQTSIGSDLFASLLPIVDQDRRGEMLWGWQRHTGFAGDNWETIVDGNPVLALTNYPLDEKPVEPSRKLPLSWRADDFGFYGFRNRWRDENDFIFQVFAKSHYVGGWNSGNAGTFRLVGLGHVWATGSTDRNRHRWEESVVQLPDRSDINGTACGKIIYVKNNSEGSGVVSIDLTDVYSGSKLRSDGKKKLPLYSRYGNLRLDDSYVDLGIDGMRSVAVDYSGRCGAPCLIAVVDHIKGGGRKVWTWQLPKGNDKTPTDVTRTTTEGNEFTITKDDGATLHGGFGGNLRPYAEIKMTTMKGGGGSTAGKTLPRPIHGVFAETTDNDAVIFFVATVQNGEPPKIRFSGRGTSTTATVGGRKVRFDGRKIILE